MRFALVAVVGLLSGCSYLGSARDFDPREFSSDPRWIRVGDTPLILQRSEKDCGAAAAAMVLAHWNRPVTLEEVSTGVGPGRGLMASDIKKLLEDRNLKAHVISGALPHIIEQATRGRPSIVGLVKPSLGKTMTHFEVIVAYHPVEQRVVTLDPARGWRENSLDGFMMEWEPVRRPMIVAYELR